MSKSYFPIIVVYETSEEEVEVNKPTDLIKGVKFWVRKTARSEENLDESSGVIEECNSAFNL